MIMRRLPSRFSLLATGFYLAVAIATSAAGPDWAELQKSWAYSKPGSPPAPTVTNKGWAHSELDRFILARLEEKGLKPAPPAEKRALIRRATYDLTGLPATPEEVQAFLKDESPEAFERVIDRLLASPHYGEKWGRHWLDVVRYTDSFDSRGIGGEADVPEAYRYRDWVVNAFNDDLPYDRFILQQIAGDILAKNSPRYDTNALVATGVYVIGEWGTGDADKEKMLTDIVDDQIDVTGRAFLGLTLACARCHDHKFDPITSEDYYGMAGIFFSSHILPNPGVKTGGSPVLRLPMASPEAISKREELQNEIKSTQAEIESRIDEAVRMIAFGSIPHTARMLNQLASARESGELRANEIAAAVGQPEAVVQAWREILGWGEPKLLTRLAKDIAGKKGVDAWQLPGADTPSASINTTDQPVPIATLSLPPKSVSVHPSPKGGVAVVWKSPAAITVRLSGSLADADEKCGDGVEWFVRVQSGLKSFDLARGQIPNGARTEFSSEAFNSIKLKEGDTIQVVIGPRGGYECDTTAVQLRLAELGGENREWDLARDVLAAPRANPCKDSYGAELWSFVDFGNSSRSIEIPADSFLARWTTASSPAEREMQAWNTQSAFVEYADLIRNGAARTDDPFQKTVSEFLNPANSIWSDLRNQVENITPSAGEKIKAGKRRLASLRSQLGPDFPRVHGLQEGGTPQTPYEGFHDAAIHIRGRYDRLGEVAPRRFPRIIAGEAPAKIESGSGRLELARWIASPENPLTARVMANRIWQHHFGEGIVRTPNNFGKLGTPPTHPELLDWLASEFVKSGWSVKTMHKLIMLSAAYQQSSIPDPATLEADPENLLFGRMNRRRLEAEELRDSLLCAADRLDSTTGGPATRDLESGRRTLYLMTIRSDRATYRTLFDAADASAIVEQRINSTVAPQALFVMNHPFALEQAAALARTVAAKPGAEDDRVQWLYEKLFSRPATSDEIHIARQFLAASPADSTGSNSSAAWEPYCQVLLASNEFMYVD